MCDRRCWPIEHKQLFPQGHICHKGNIDGGQEQAAKASGWQAGCLVLMMTEGRVGIHSIRAPLALCVAIRTFHVSHAPWWHSTSCCALRPSVDENYSDLWALIMSETILTTVYLSPYLNSKSSSSRIIINFTVHLGKPRHGEINYSKQVERKSPAFWERQSDLISPSYQSMLRSANSSLLAKWVHSLLF